MSVNYEALWKEQGMDYDQYRSIMAEQVEKGVTSGPIQNEAMSNYTALNERRMLRLDRKTELLAPVEGRLKMVVQPQHWLVITETWCGDAAQILPALQKMVKASEAIDMKLIWRDENKALMDEHLTNGSRAIPKLIALDAEFEILGEWGPRPRDAQEMVMQNKTVMAKIQDAEVRKDHYQNFQADLQKWYNKDKGESTQTEMLVEIEKWQL